MGKCLDMNTNKVYVSDEILLYAFRYAIGRMTYVVTDVVETLKINWIDISYQIKLIIRKEIKQAIIDNKIGMQMDKKLWEKILKLKVK